MNACIRNCCRRGSIALSLLALIIGIVSTITPLTAAETLRVGKAVPEAFSFVPLDVGMRQGIFQKHGLTIESIAFAGDAKLQQAAAADGVDIALGSGPAMAFIVKGSPVKAVGALTGAPELMSIIVKPDGAVREVADLKGKKVGVSTAGSLTFWLVTELSRRQGWGLDGIQVLPMGGTPGQIAALARGEIDGVVLDIATAYELEGDGKARVLTHFGKSVKDFHTNVIYASDRLIAARPQAVKAFLAAWFETVAYMTAHKAESVAITRDVIHKSDRLAERTYDILQPVFSIDGRFNPQALATLGKSFVDMKLLPQEPDMTALYTEKFLP